ncbi:MAG TPA: hypothetical protein VGI23_21915, partial [Steroidobacteraceae bacterium]
RHAQRLHVLTPEAADDLNHKIFASPTRPPKYSADPRRPQGRSSSLRYGRSTSTPTAVHRAKTRTGTRQHRKNSTDPIFTGVPNTDKENK